MRRIKKSVNGLEYLEPRVRKDRDNKKWFVEYYIRRHGEEEFQRRREYGKDLNREKDLKERQRNADALRIMLLKKLEAGHDPKSKEDLLSFLEQVKSQNKECSFETLFKYYCDLRGYTKPKSKQVKSAANVKRFFNHKFLKEFLIPRKLEGDLRDITRAHILEFLNTGYFNEDEGKRWNNTTYNNIKTWLSAFFNAMIHEEKLTINPCTNIRSKPKVGKKRYNVFTKEEISILFNHLDEVDFNYKVACMMIYWAYIRESEIVRLTVDCVDLENRIIKIQPEMAKGASDGLERDVAISKDLKVALTKYLEFHSHSPSDFLFGKGTKPSKYPLSASWYEKFKDYTDGIYNPEDKERYNGLRHKHPGLFDRDGLTMYALKHSGVTHFVNDNMKAKGSLSVLRFVQSQCRHTHLETTQIYLAKLPVNMKEMDELNYEGF